MTKTADTKFLPATDCCNRNSPGENHAPGCRSQAKALAPQRAIPRGLEQGSPEDMILPHVTLLQPMSKMATKEGATLKAGDLVNSLTEQKYDSVEFIPITYQHFFNVYRYEGSGAKAKKIFDFRTSDKNDPKLKGRRWKGDDNGKREIEPVMRFLCLVNHQPAVIDFSKSSIQGGKKLYTLASLARTDLFANAYKLKVIRETNDMGTFYVKDVEPLGPAGKDEYAECEALHAAFGSPKAPKVADVEEEVPF